MTVNLCILQTDSSHCEVYQDLLIGDHAPLSGQARIISIWGEDLDQARTQARDGVSVAATIDQAVTDVDGIMICGRWGDSHFDVAMAALSAGKPVYVDKSFTDSSGEAQAIVSAYKEQNVPLFSASPLRFAGELEDFLTINPPSDLVLGGTVTGLGQWPDFGDKGRRIFFYGVHAMEIVSALFGPGIQKVKSVKTDLTELVTLYYGDGRLVSLRLLQKGAERYEAAVIGHDRTLPLNIAADGDFYQRTLAAIIAFVKTGEPPVPVEHTVEIVAVLEAIEAARNIDGWVSIAQNRLRVNNSQ